MKFEIREAILNDYENIMPIYREVYNLHVQGRPDKFNTTNSTLDLNYFTTLVENEKSKVYIVVYDEKVIAFAFLRVFQTESPDTSIKRKCVFMNDFGVTEGFRGKGIGKFLFNKSLEFTKEVGATSLELGVMEFNEKAIKFYEAMGMKTQSRKMEIKI